MLLALSSYVLLCSPSEDCRMVHGWRVADRSLFATSLPKKGQRQGAKFIHQPFLYVAVLRGSNADGAEKTAQKLLAHEMLQTRTTEFGSWKSPAQPSGCATQRLRHAGGR